MPLRVRVPAPAFDKGVAPEIVPVMVPAALLVILRAVLVLIAVALNPALVTASVEIALFAPTAPDIVTLPPALMVSLDGLRFFSIT